MKDTKNALISSVKKVVAEYGITGITARKLSASVGVNEALIYHYFDNLDEAICLAYEKESTDVFNEMENALNSVSDIPFSLKEKTRLCLHRIWRALLSDTERELFLSVFYHSFYFREEIEFHNKQVDVLQKRLRKYFNSDEECKQILYAITTLLYESAARVIIGIDKDTKELEERIFKLCYSLIEASLKERLFI